MTQSVRVGTDTEAEFKEPKESIQQAYEAWRDGTTTRFLLGS
jgi:hypothetical protein